MTRAEFIRELKESLEGHVPQSVIAENVRYYENYIEERKNTGRTESEIIEELGSPRLIARSIIDAADQGQMGSDVFEETYTENGQEDSWQDDFYEASVRKMKAGCVTAILITMIVMVAVFHIVAFLWPVLVVLLIVYLIWQHFR